MDQTKSDRLKSLLLVLAFTWLIGGLALYVGGRPDPAPTFWFAGVAPVLAALVVEITRSLMRGDERRIV